MELQTFANIAEIVGAVVVVATVIYLAIQIRQNNELLRSQSRQALLSNDQASLLVALENTDIFEKMHGGELTTEDQYRLSMTYTIDMRNREFEYFQYKAGALDEDAGNSFQKIILINHATEKGRRWWRNVGREVFDPGFAATVDELIDGVEDDHGIQKLGNWDHP